LEVRGNGLARGPLKKGDAFFHAMKLSSLALVSKSTVVLLIDDEGIRAAIHDVLRLKGYDIIDELSLVRSMEILREGQAQCAIIDQGHPQLKMPAEIIPLMCAAVPAVSFVLLVGEERLGEAVTDLPGVTVLTKPFDVMKLLEVLPPVEV
jgi:DNA-binding NtrC family response regulator